MHDPSATIIPDQLDDIEVEPEAVENCKPMRIVGNDTKQLRRKAVKLVKVQWGENVKDCTWETEEDIRKKYPESLPGKALVVIVSSLVSKPHARIDLFCMLIVVLWLIGMRDPLCVLVREFRGRNFLRGENVTTRILRIEGS